jgi:hypothetical protein
MTLPGPSKTVIVEPLEAPAGRPRPAPAEAPAPSPAAPPPPSREPATT